MASIFCVADGIVDRARRGNVDGSVGLFIELIAQGKPALRSLIEAEPRTVVLPVGFIGQAHTNRVCQFVQHPLELERFIKDCLNLLVAKHARFRAAIDENITQLKTHPADGRAFQLGRVVGVGCHYFLAPFFPVALGFSVVSSACFSSSVDWICC